MRSLLLASAVLGLLAGQARADFMLDFEGLKDNEAIANYYNGGFGGFGSGPGPNFGVTFASNALISIASSAGGIGNFSNQPSGVAVAYFIGGINDFMNVPAGFSSLSFFYSATNSGIVNVYSGLNGTGTLLGSISVASTNNNGPPGGFANNWAFASTTLSGTAMSVDFSGIANVGTAGYGIDNLTLGTSSPQATPEPASITLLAVGAVGLMGYAWGRRKKGQAAA